MLEELCRIALASPEFLAEFDRLRGTNLRLRGTALDLKIDVASGRLKRDAALLVEFLADLALRI